MSAQVSVEQDKVAVQPGVATTLMLKLANPTDVVDIFDITILGPAAPFATVVPGEVHLFPQHQGDSVVSVTLPPDTQLSGLVSIGFKVTSRAQPQDSVVEEATLEVAGAPRVSIELHPRRVEGKLRSRHRLVLTNAGNQPATVDLSGTDVNDELSVDFRPRHVVVPAGSTARVSVKVTAARFSAGTDRPFQVFAQVLGQGVPAADGTLAQRRARPGWLLPVVGLAGIAMVAAVVLSLGSKPHSTAIQRGQLAGTDQATTSVGGAGAVTTARGGAATTTGGNSGGAKGTATTKVGTATTVNGTATTIGGGTGNLDPPVPGGGGEPGTPVSFIHTASPANSSGDHSVIDNPATNGNPNAIVLVTQNQSPPGGRHVLDNANLGVYYNGEKWAVFHQNRTTPPAGAAYNIAAFPAPGAQTFIHIANPANSSGDHSLIDNPATNGNPDAIIVVTQNWSPPGGQNIYDDAALGVYYNGEQWAVFHQNRTTPPAGAAYNIAVYPPTTLTFIHTAHPNNSREYNTSLIDNPATNSNPNAILVVTQNWSPPGGQNTYDNAALGLYYNGEQWAVFHQDLTTPPAGAAYNIAVLGYAPPAPPASPPIHNPNSSAVLKPGPYYCKMC